MSDLEVMQKRQKVLADFGDFALQSEDLDAVLHEACRLVGEALGTGRAKVLEIEPGGESLLVRAGVGWGPDVVGHVHIPMGENSSESYAIEAGVPVITQDISKEDRFGLPDFLKEAGIVALANVPIFLLGKRAYGLLQVDDTGPRDFDQDDTEFLRTYATILGPVIDRLFKAQALQVSEAQQAFLLKVSDALRPLNDPVLIQVEASRLLGEHLDSDRAYYVEVDEARGEFVVARDWHRLGATSHARRYPLKDWSMPWLASGKTWVVCDVATDPALPDEQRDAYTGNEIGALIVVPLLRDGRLVATCLTNQSTPRDWTAAEVHLVEEVAARTRDAVERARAEAALRESEERFRQFGDASGDVLWIRNAETLEFEYVNPAVEEVYGVRPEDFLAGNQMLRWVGMIVPEDRELALSHIRRVREGGHVLNAFRILRRSDGKVRWIRDHSFPLLDAQGRVQRIGGIGHDATEEIELQDRLTVLVAELQHRTRNLMGVVRSVTDKTLSSSTSLPDFQGRIRDRLNALARVNSLLSRLDGGSRITFDELLLTELMAHGVVEPNDPSSQVRLEGPEGIRLRSSTVQTLALGLHELATNALKYGALSRPEGRLSVTWDLVDGPDAEPRLRVEWRESGVPMLMVVPDSSSGGEMTAPRRRGYGRELIERALPYQLKAETTYELTPDGVRCTITLPVSSSMGGGGETVKEAPDG